MDEYSSGMDPEMKKYFRKILNSFFVGLIWMITMVTAGIFFRLGIIQDGVNWYHVVFYVLFLLSFIWLLRYYFRAWKGKQHH